MCALQLTIHHPSLSALLSYYIRLFCMLFFFCFKPLVTPLFIQLFCNNIYVSSNKEGADLIKTVQLFEFHFIPNYLKAFKVINWKIWEQILWMALICVMISLFQKKNRMENLKTLLQNNCTSNSEKKHVKQR